MSVDVVVIGAGGFGRETLDVIEAHNAFFQSLGSYITELRVSGIVDDFPSQQNLERLEKRQYRYLGTIDRIIAELEPHGFILAIGDPQTRSLIDRKFTDAGWSPVSVVHPTATLGSQCELGEGNIICAGAQISTNTQFGRHVHVNPNTTIGHDSVLEDFVSINPGAVISGEVTIQRNTLVGAASVVLEGLHIGISSIIGASACVVKNVEAGSTVIGVPARPLRQVASHASTSSASYDRDLC